MLEETEPHHQSFETPTSASPEAPPEVARTARIKTIGGALTHSGKAYKVIELDNGEKIRAFEARQAKGLSEGMEVDYVLAKNARTGYWDLKWIHPAGTQPEEPTPSPEPAPGSQAVADGSNERHLDEREWGMRSMNALTNATTLLAALIEKDIVRPKDVAEACALVGDLHQIMMKMHEHEKPTHEV